MDKIVFFLVSLLTLSSCKKDKIPECTNVEMTGDKSMLVGKWEWYNTWVEEWFDVGAPIHHNYTPENQGFQYFFTISTDGKFKGYRNDTLINQHIFTGIIKENFQGSSINSAYFNVDCKQEQISFFQSIYNSTNDSIHNHNYPLNFRDEENHLESKQNFFVKVE